MHYCSSEPGHASWPNPRATETQIHEGLAARSVNCWPSVEFDLLSVNGFLARLIPVGFYYKTFMWPRSAWLTYERFIRKASGFGRAPDLPDPDRYDRINAFCDVLVVGGGPAGLGAALAAGEAGARVVVVDEQGEFGGSLLGSREPLDGNPAMEWVEGVVASLGAMEHVRIIPRATAYGYHDHNFLTVLERLTDHLPERERRGARERVWRIRAREVVIATGAIERPLVFANNDRPGVMLAASVAMYANRYGVRAGERIVVFTNNDSAYRAALDLRAVGSEVVVVDARSTPSGDLPARSRAAGIRSSTRASWWVCGVPAACGASRSCH